MFNKIILSIILIASPLIWAVNDSTKTDMAKHGFVGAEFCGMCHRSEKAGKQLDIWKASQHA